MNKRLMYAACLVAGMFFCACGGSDNGSSLDIDVDTDTKTDTDTGDTSTLPTYSTPDRANVLSFPGVKGAGQYTIGGAGGTVYTVTSLADDGSEGTLRYAIEKSGKRTVVFAVGGVIELTKQLKISNDSITIAGQTAPGNGICLKNYTLRVDANEVIIRYIRCRMGDEEQTEDDAMNGYQSSYPGRNHVVIDHCSMSWSTDECASFYGNTCFTMQWCVICESLTHSIHQKGTHGYGGIWGGSPATFHHNLLAHHSNRTPRLCGSRYSNRADMEKVDLINNVVYNWTNEGAYGAQGGSYNIMNNYYKIGPAGVDGKTHARFFTAYVDDGTNSQASGVYGYFYLSGNYMDVSCSGASSSQQTEAANANADNTCSTAFVVKNNATDSSNLLVSSRFDIVSDYGFMEDVGDAYTSVLTYAGSWNCGWTTNGVQTPSRDAIDKRVCDDTTNATYSSTASNGGGYGLIDTQTDAPEGGWSNYSTASASLTDTDGDGMPDEWETAKGLNPNDASDGPKYNLSEIYTNLEVYLNALVESTFPSSQLN